MGYTIYFVIDRAPKGKAREFERKYKKACKRIGEYARMVRERDGIRLAGYTAHARPGSYGGVRLNGAGEEAHEALELPEHYANAAGTHFVKTNRKPYTPVVMGALLILKKELGRYVRLSDDDGLLGVASRGLE
jgi:hypothetical protein